MKRAIIPAVTFLLLAALGTTLWFSHGDKQVVSPPPSQSLTSHARLVTADQPATVAYQSSRQALSGEQQALLAASGEETEQAMAPSLVGTEVDGELLFDRWGQVVIHAGLRRYFDYFLSTMGERSMDQIRDRLGRHLDNTVLPVQRLAVLDLFDRYVDYLWAVDEMTPAADLSNRWQQLHALRRSLLGAAMADAFFAEEEAYTAFVLEQQNNGTNSSQLNNNPSAARHQAATAHHQVLEQSRQYQALDISPQQRFAERRILYGKDAATRLAQLDQQQQQWQQRVTDYRQQREQILQQNDNATKQIEQLLKLRADLFNESEQRRIQALEEAGFPEQTED